MGLDGVEIILRVEDTFQIAVGDSEASEVSTVGDLCDLVLRHLGEEASVLENGVLTKGQKRRKTQGNDACLTSRAFYVVRRELTQILGIKRSDLRPSTKIEHLLPWNKRRAVWRTMQEDTKLKFPALGHPRWIHLLFLSNAILACFLPFERGLISTRLVAIIWTPILTIILYGMLLKLTPQLQISLPTKRRTVGDLARDVLALNFAKFDGSSTASPREVVETIRRIIADQMQIDLDEIKPESHFTKDLGID
jgi:acyl carrier protein